MTQPAYANVPAVFLGPHPITFIAANGTVAKVVVEPMPAQVAASPAPPFYGGGTILDLTAVSTAATAVLLNLYMGQVTTTQSIATGNISTTTSTFDRALGSFLSDGWRVGDLAMAFAPENVAPNASVDGILAQVTSVSALTLTLNGTPLAALSPLAAGTRLARVGLLFRSSVPAQSGSTGASKNVNLIGHALDSATVRTEVKLGADSLLIAAPVSAVPALPAYVSLVPRNVARY